MPRKKIEPQTAESKPGFSEEITAFTVKEVTGEIQGKTYYQPTMLKIRGSEIEEHPLQEATIYEALAYEYLIGDVQQYYAGLWLQNVRTKERV